MTRRRLMLLGLSLYPAWWRRRYGAEAAAILEQTPTSSRAALDLLRGALDAWTRQRPPQPFFARLGDEARHVIVLAQKEAYALHHNYVGTEHILLGLLAAPDGEAAQLLIGLGVSPERVRTRVLQLIGRGGDAPLAACVCSRSAPGLPKWSLCLTPRVKRGFELSCRTADRLNDPHVEGTHLLLGLLDEGKGVGTTILAELVDPKRVRQELARLRSR